MRSGRYRGTCPLDKTPRRGMLRSMVEIAEIKDEDSLGSWLKPQLRELSTTVAVARLPGFTPDR